MTGRNWLFEDAPDSVVVADRAIVCGERAILLACHYKDGDGWAFLTGEQVSNDEMMLVALEQVVGRDPSLGMLAALPEGWSASRSKVGETWKFFEDVDI